MKRLLTLVVLLLVAFSFSAIEVSASNGRGRGRGRIEDTSYTYETTGTFRWSGEEYSIKYWVSAQVFTGGPIFIRYESENMEFDQLSISNNVNPEDKEFIHIPKRNLIILMPSLFYETIIAHEDEDNPFPYISFMMVFENEEQRHSHVSSVWIDQYNGIEDMGAAITDYIMYKTWLRENPNRGRGRGRGGYRR